jgi:hypothetical protein
MQIKRNSLKGGGGARRPSLKYRAHRPTPSNVGGATTPVSGGSGVQPSVSIIKRKLSHGNSLSFYGPTATTSDDGGIISGGGIRLVNEDEPLFDDNGGGGVSTTGLNDAESQHPMMPNTTDVTATIFASFKCFALNKTHYLIHAAKYGRMEYLN